MSPVAVLLHVVSCGSVAFLIGFAYFVVVSVATDVVLGPCSVVVASVVLGPCSAVARDAVATDSVVANVVAVVDHRCWPQGQCFPPD